ncbi:Uncharacterised protein [Mycobacteroides abscessus subsp. abscessus]|nr:Uncharacterised protein [Mycobacteroides abscessus subsp. abscessus]
MWVRTKELVAFPRGVVVEVCDPGISIVREADHPAPTVLIG